MMFKSTRGLAPKLNFSEALFKGLAADGGLYVPEEIPQFKMSAFAGELSVPLIGEEVLTPFINDPRIKNHLGEICRSAFNFAIPLNRIDDNTAVLELYHGPTAAFKDVGARFLAACVTRLADRHPRTVIVATSGDTGGAVAAAFHRQKNIEVVILFPKGMVSAFQETQLTCWGDNVKALKVRGTFDDCQRLVKEAMLAPSFREKNLISANSVNIGRILPQVVYYAWSSLTQFKETGQPVGFIVPTGNLGNGLAALWAKAMGFPISKVALACNANQAVVNYLATGQWQPMSTISTLANAMDVGAPSNFERLRYLYLDLESLNRDVVGFSISDAEIRHAIKINNAKYAVNFCPHTATAAAVRAKLDQSQWVIVATAHAAKFRSVVEPIVGPFTPPPTLDLFVNRQSHSTEIDATLENLSAALR